MNDEALPITASELTVEKRHLCAALILLVASLCACLCALAL
jgi:hypothetical protein